METDKNQKTLANNLEQPVQKTQTHKRPNRDYSFASQNHKNRHIVKAVNLESDEGVYYHSLYSCSKHLGINCGIIKMCSEGKNHVKSGISKIDGGRYRFEYVEETPEDVKVLKSKDVKN